MLYFGLGLNMFSLDFGFGMCITLLIEHLTEDLRTKIIMLSTSLFSVPLITY